MINSHHILSCRLIKQHTVYVGRIQQNISHLPYLLGHFLIYHLCQTCWQKCRKIVEVDIFQVNFPSLHNIMCQTHLFEFLRCTCMGILSVNIGKQNHLLVHNVRAIYILSLHKIVTQHAKVVHTVYLHCWYYFNNSHYLFSSGFVAHWGFSPWSNLW